tara:strand:+ start:390 stop:788 length:399 start_codon:yes stop_codon:yes gene_type:complete
MEIINPIKAILNIDPNLVRSVDVVYPTIAMTPKVPDVTRNVTTKLEEVYAKKTKLRLTPVIIEYKTNILNMEGNDNFCIRAPINKISPIGENITIHPNIVVEPVVVLYNNSIKSDVPKIYAANPDIANAPNI